MSRDLRRSLEAAAELGRRCGFRIRESDLRDINGTVTVHLELGNEWIEIFFRENPETGYLRFRGASQHLDNDYSDRYDTWRDTARMVESTGRSVDDGDWAAMSSARREARAL